MAPTFPIFLGFILYIPLIGLSLLIGLPMMLFEKWRVSGVTLILTALISFPTLIIIGLTLTVLFALPGIGLIYLLHYLGVLPLIPYFILLFMLIVAVSALYHWYIGYRMIKNYLNDEYIDFQIENDKIYSIFLKRIINWKRKNSIGKWPIRK